MRSPIMPAVRGSWQARECRRFEQQRFDQPSARIAEVFAIVKDQQRMFERSAVTTRSIDGVCS